jgi:tRNA 2-selenouridine synthase
MPAQKITIEQFLGLSTQYPVLDVRSPGEYLHAHIPGAYSLPLFTDEERKLVGTAYKQQSRQTAIKLGLDFFGGKMRKMVEEIEQLSAEKWLMDEKRNLKTNERQAINTVLVHCWRGGMRSAGVAWLLDLYGFKVYTLVGGYKAYRKWVRDQFEMHCQLTVVGGYTGSAKTGVLQQLKHADCNIIDLEKLAHHKGSAFGALGELKQPTQEMFENLLAQELNHLKNSLTQHAFIEDESQRIGLLKIPDPFWDIMRKSRVCFLDIPFEERLNYLTAEYGKHEKEKLVNAIIRIKKRLGGLETKTAICFLVEDNYKECFRILLKYYDKWYSKGLENRENLDGLLHKISCNSIDVKLNAEKVLEEMKKLTASRING